MLRVLKADPEFRRNLAEVEFMSSLEWTPEQIERYNDRMADLAFRTITWRPGKARQ